MSWNFLFKIEKELFNIFFMTTLSLCNCPFKKLSSLGKSCCLEKRWEAESKFLKKGRQIVFELSSVIHTYILPPLSCSTSHGWQRGGVGVKEKTDMWTVTCDYTPLSCTRGGVTPPLHVIFNRIKLPPPPPPPPPATPSKGPNMGKNGHAPNRRRCQTDSSSLHLIKFTQWSTFWRIYIVKSKCVNQTEMVTYGNHEK